MYSVVRNQPVARFYYKGHHSHPVRRTVLVTESNSRYIKGYEIREGSTIRAVADAPVKTFRRDSIATFKQCRRGVRTNLNQNALQQSTLVRESLLESVISGF